MEKKDTVIIVRISKKDKEELKKKADAKRISLSAYIMNKVYA